MHVPTRILTCTRIHRQIAGILGRIRLLSGRLGPVATFDTGFDDVPDFTRSTSVKQDTHVDHRGRNSRANSRRI
jgi:hypothetical protein